MQNEYLLSDNHMQRCKYPEEYINTKPNIYSLDVTDIHAIYISSKIKLNSLYVANYLIKKQLLRCYKPITIINDIVFKKQNLFFKISLRTIDDIKFIKDIVSRKCLFHDKHIITIEINESISKEIFSKLFSILKSNFNIFFIIYTDICIPIEIKQVCMNVCIPASNNSDPFNDYVDTCFQQNNNQVNSSNLINSFITKHIEKLLKCQSNDVYYNTLRKFTLNITASGIQIQQVAQQILILYPDADIESLTLMESKSKKNVKSIFSIEHYINKIILKLKKID